MKSCEDIADSLYSQHLLTLRIYRMTKSPLFENAYTASSDVQKEIALQFIKNLNERGLYQWIRTQLRVHNLYEQMLLKDLRILASEVGVKNYAYMTKIEIVSEILYHEQKRSSRTNNKTTTGNVTVTEKVTH